MDGQNYLETILADFSSFQEQKADERETLFETYLATWTTFAMDTYTHTHTLSLSHRHTRSHSICGRVLTFQRENTILRSQTVMLESANYSHWKGVNAKSWLPAL